MNKLLAIVLLVSASAMAFNANAFTCGDLDGSYVNSQENTPVYLGFFGNSVASESIMNTVGNFGSSVSSYSVRNTVGTYGSSVGTYSANNSVATYPPKIFKNGLFIAYLTTNTIKTPRVSLADIDASCTTFSSSQPSYGSGDLPAPPAQVDASDGTVIGGVSVNWSLVTGATSYNLYYSANIDSTKNLIGQYTLPPVNLTGGSPGVAAYFWVYSVNATGESATGTYDTGYPQVDSPPLNISGSYSGIWWNPNQDGHGLNIVVLDENTTVVYWYTYHTDGTPMFLLTVGSNQGNSTTGPTYYHTGMKFGEFNPNDVESTVWGTSTLTFSDCNTVTLQYSSDEPAYGSGTIQMERAASVDGLTCLD